MPWWGWLIIGIAIYIALVFGVWAICKAGADEDREMGR